MTPEEYISKAIEVSGMTITTASKRSGVEYSKLQPSIRGRREFRAEEYLALCAMFKLDPRGFEEAESA